MEHLEKIYDLVQILHVRVLLQYITLERISAQVSVFITFFLLHDNMRFLSFLLFIFYSFVFMRYLFKILMVCNIIISLYLKNNCIVYIHVYIYTYTRLYR